MAIVAIVDGDAVVRDKPRVTNFAGAAIQIAGVGSEVIATGIGVVSAAMKSSLSRW